VANTTSIPADRKLLHGTAASVGSKSSLGSGISTRGIGSEATAKPDLRHWLVANGKRFGFHSTVAGEPWHWEYRPGKRARRWPALCPDPPPAR
jgi:hypothetical protein